MKKGFLKNKVAMMALVLSLSILFACNKNVDNPVPNTIVAPSGKTIGQLLGENSDYSLLAALVEKAGLKNAVLDPSKSFTVFAPDNKAIKRFINGFTGGQVPVDASDDFVLVAINNAPPAVAETLTRIVNYHILPGQAIKAEAIDTVQNIQYPTNFIFPSPNTSPLVRFTSFVSKRGSNAWVNNIPVTAPNLITASNGIVHGIAAVLLPPSKILLDTISSDKDFSYLVAAIQRADSGLNKNAAPSFQYYLGKDSIAPAVNFTVFAPTNQAFKYLIFGLVYKQVFARTFNVDSAQSYAEKAVNAGPDFLKTNNVTTLQLRGIIAHHVIASKRIFSVNFPQTPTNYTTFYNVSVPNDKGLEISTVLNQNRFGVALSVKGSSAESGEAPAQAQLSPFGIDNHAVNGVFYKINKVLLPKLPSNP